MKHSAIVHNIYKYAIEMFYQMGLAVFNESICYSLDTNAYIVNREKNEKKGFHISILYFIQ